MPQRRIPDRPAGLASPADACMAGKACLLYLVAVAGVVSGFSETEVNRGEQVLIRG
jgi:hypothetical protein